MRMCVGARKASVCVHVCVGESKASVCVCVGVSKASVRVHKGEQSESVCVCTEGVKQACPAGLETRSVHSTLDLLFIKIIMIMRK